MNDIILSKYRKYANDISALTDVPLSILDNSTEAAVDITKSNFCAECNEKNCMRYSFHVHESSIPDNKVRGNQYDYSMYFCPCGFIFVNFGELIVGPVYLNDAGMPDKADVFSISSDKLQGLISVLFRGVIAVKKEISEEIEAEMQNQDKPLKPNYAESVYVHDNASQLINLQKKLIPYLKNKNKISKEKYLYEIIGTLFPHMQVRSIVAGKLQAIELIMLLTQSAIVAGLTFDLVLGKYSDYMAVIGGIKDEKDLKQYLTELFSYFLDTAKAAYRTLYSPRIVKCIEFIEDHYAEKITLKEMAEYLNLSANYVGQLFEKETGKTFRTYLTELRAEKSKELLKDLDMQLWDVAQRVGFEDQSYYTNIFKKSMGVTPSEYRMSIRNKKNY